ncbi:hypothetical protein Ga0466249_005311 [Sporomusaceae bacterium BoRhaA]|nr:hypothetical protein [Pelorhabdus rhamnosifermentans]
MKCKLNLAEYCEGVYSGDLNYPIIDYTPPTSKLVDVSDLSLAEESYRTVEGVNVSLIHASWILQRNQTADSFHVWYSDDNVNFKFWGTTYDMKSTISGIIPGKTYYVKVCVSNGIQQSSGIVKSVAVVGNDGVPPVVTNISAEEHSRDQGNGVVVTDLYVSFTPPAYQFYKNCDAYLKSNNPAADEIIEIPDSLMNTPYDELADALQGWKFAGNPINQLIIQNVLQGHEYSVKLVSVAKGDIKADFDSAPVYKYTVGGKTYQPYTPTGLQVSITDTAQVTWNAPAQTDVDFSEVRIDTNVGSDAGKLAKTTANKAIVTLPSRSGKVYLYHHNTAGKYSDPAWATWNKPAPIAPGNIAIADIFQGIVITCATLPQYCSGINVHINDGSGDVVYFSPNNSYTFKSTGGIYDVQLAYVDLFGEGEKSAIIQKVISPTIDPALLAAESLSLDKMDAIIKAAVAKAKVSIDTTSFNDAIAGRVSYTDFNDKVNTLVQADSTNASAIQQTSTSLTNTVAKLNSDAGSTGQYAAISQVKQQADGLTTTVQGNKTTQDGINSSFSSQVTQQANQITSVVTDMANANTVIAQNTSDIQLRATKANLISLINICPEAITIDGKWLHVSALSTFDDNVIVGRMLQAGSVSTNKIVAGAITADKLNVSSLSAICATIGTLRTATTGARTEISDNLICVYDSNNVLRVRMGVW